MNFDETYVVADHSKIFSIFPILNNIKILLKAEEQYPFSDGQLLFRDYVQILLLILIKFNRINWLLFPLKSWEKHELPDHFKGDKS